MRLGKSLLGVALVAGFAALPLSSASAYPCNPVSGVFGAAATVVGGAVTIATAPLVILAGDRPRFVDHTCAYHEARYYARPYVEYDGPPTGYYTPPEAYDEMPPASYSYRHYDDDYDYDESSPDY
jgi:hypothetical protein